MGFVGGMVVGGLRRESRVCKRPRIVTSAVNGRRRVERVAEGPPDLCELTKRLGDLLLSEADNGLLHVERERESVQVNETTHVAVVLGKTLIRDQITVEYAKRVFRLVTQIASYKDQTKVVCFMGCKGEGLVSEAAAGYTFFRSICEQCHVDISGLKFVLLESSYNKGEALRDVFKRINQTLEGNVLQRCHFTFISSDYHLFRVQEIHRLSPSNSLLRPLVVAKSTWDFAYASYPFCVSTDTTTAFRGRVMVLTSDMYIVIANLEAVISERVFFSKENWERLNTSVAKLRRFYEILHHPKAMFPGDRRVFSEVLEICIANLREAQKILCQLVESSGNTTERDLKRARDLVLEAVTSIRRKIDPDQPIALGDVESLQNEIESYLLNQTHARIADPELSDNSIETIMPETIMPEKIMPDKIMPETESKASRRNAKRSVRTRARKKEPQDIM